MEEYWRSGKNRSSRVRRWTSPYPAILQIASVF